MCVTCLSESDPKVITFEMRNIESLNVDGKRYSICRHEHISC